MYLSISVVKYKYNRANVTKDLHALISNTLFGTYLHGEIVFTHTYDKSMFML